MSNRVEELESKVSELQAAVNGLTEELVEMKERVRELEDRQDVEVEGESGLDEPAPGDTGSEIIAHEPTTAESGEVADDEGDDDVKGEEVEDADNEESEDSDIIVA